MQATNSNENGILYREKDSFLEEKTLVEKSVPAFELTFTPLLAGSGLLPGTCKMCDVDYIN